MPPFSEPLRVLYLGVYLTGFLGILERSILDRLERSILYSKRGFSLTGHLSEIDSWYFHLTTHNGNYPENLRRQR